MTKHLSHLRYIYLAAISLLVFFGYWLPVALLKRDCPLFISEEMFQWFAVFPNKQQNEGQCKNSQCACVIECTLQMKFKNLGDRCHFVFSYLQLSSGKKSNVHFVGLLYISIWVMTMRQRNVREGNWILGIYHLITQQLFSKKILMSYWLIGRTVQSWLKSTQEQKENSRHIDTLSGIWQKRSVTLGQNKFLSPPLSIKHEVTKWFSFMLEKTKS